MKAAPFDYYAPETAAEATQLLADLGDEAKVLAGGQSLIPMLALRLAIFEQLVDIGRIPELKGIERRGDDMWIGAATTEAAVGASPEIAETVPLLTRVTPLIGHFQIRNKGTIGGSIAHADPAAEYPTVALALDASLEVLSVRGTRSIAASEFFDGLWSTTLEPDELMVGMTFPIWAGRSGFAVEEFARRHGDFAIAGATVGVELDAADRITRCSVGLIGLGSTPLRAAAAEANVVGTNVAEINAKEFGNLAVADLEDIPADLQGDSGYRRRVGATMVERAWTAAVTEAVRTAAAQTEARHG
jgi:carbon-monoxide dehydrogenase medium subunit